MHNKQVTKLYIDEFSVCFIFGCFLWTSVPFVLFVFIGFLFVFFLCFSGPKLRHLLRALFVE